MMLLQLKDLFELFVKSREFHHIKPFKVLQKRVRDRFGDYTNVTKG